ncbi:hypothetical protein VTO42DRAFT_4453 [Malbranchea cinnamomea]
MADPASHISVGALSAIFDDTKPKIPEPIVQCVHIRLLPNPSKTADRYRAVFSDISNYVQTMLATQTNHLVTSGVLRRGCFVRLRSYQANYVKGKCILIILDLEVLEELGECEKIGDPKPLELKAINDQKPVPTAISSNGFPGVKQQNPNVQPVYAPQPLTPAVSSAHANIYPIEALSPYSNNKWTIKARCTHKSPIKTWHNRNGEGKLFSVNLLDDSGEIRATAFKDQCDLLYNVFEEGSVYYISSPCRVQIAKKEFSNVNNDYELTFEKDTVVEKAEEQDDVPQVRFNFTSISDLQSVEKGTTIDVLGILKDIGGTTQISSKTTGKPYSKRDLTIVDNTGYSVRLTVWGDMATSFDVKLESVLAFKGVKVSDFGGKSLSLLSSGSMTVDPDIEEAHRLKGWYDAQGRMGTFSSHASDGNLGITTGQSDPFKTISEIRDEQLGMSDKADFFSLKATVIYVKQGNLCYPSCLIEGCNKKVVEIGPDQWRCEKHEITHPKPEYRYVLSVNVSDHTGALWLSCFDEVGRLLLGMTADQWMELQENDPKAASEAVHNANCSTWNFRCKAKLDTFQEQQRIRYQVTSAAVVDYSAEASRLMTLIDSYKIE